MGKAVAWDPYSILERRPSPSGGGRGSWLSETVVGPAVKRIPYP